jgi:transglutaminase-like putative cysteine protease
MDPAAKVRESAIEALEKVKPELYKPLVTILLDKDIIKHVEAIKDIGLLDKDGRPAVSVLLSHVKKTFTNRRIPRVVRLTLIQADFEALTAVAPDDQTVLKFLLSVAKANARDPVPRGLAIQSLGSLAESRPAVSKQILPVLLKAIKNPELRLTAIEVAGRLGPDAKTAVPVLKKFKLNPVEEIRKAAAEALERIEGSSELPATVRENKNKPARNDLVTDLKTANQVKAALVDQHALAANPEAESSIPKLAKYLAQGCKTDLEKARAIYRWTTDRVAYDAEGLFAGTYTSEGQVPEVVLRDRKAVCEGYANLFVALANQMRFKTTKVQGFAKGLGYKPGQHFKQVNHSWNAVLLGKKWRLVDATWGAGYVNGKTYTKRFSDVYFLSDPENLLFTHLPANARWQLVKRPLTLRQFERQPYVSRSLMEVGVSAMALRTAAKAKSFREFPHVYPYPGKTVEFLRGPLSKFLRVNAENVFAIRSDSHEALVAIVDGKFIPFERQKTIFRLKLKASKGLLRISGKLKGGDNRYWGILDYTVE